MLGNFRLQSPDFRSGLFLSIIFVFGSLALLFASLQFLEPQRIRPRIPYLSPPHIQHLTFGFKEHAADLLWIRAIQDFDYCEQEVAKATCQSTGWLFKMLDVVTDLAPHFRMPFATGGLALTVLVNDFPGASKIFDKAVQQFPNDWSILSRAAYHALYEEKDKEKAARLLKRAGEAGGPKWYFMLATRLSTEAGDIEFGEAMIKQLENEPNPDTMILKALREKIEKARKTPSAAH